MVDLERPARSAAHRVVRVGIADHHQRTRTLRHPQLRALDLAPGQECRARRRTAVRAVAVERGDELVRDLVSDGIASAASPQHDNTLEEAHTRRGSAGSALLPPSTGPVFVNVPRTRAKALID